LPGVPGATRARWAPSDQIALEDAPDGTRKDSLELALTAYDGEGKALNSVGQVGAVAIKPEMLARFLAAPFEIPLELDLPAGALFVRVGVLDRTSNKVGTLEIPVTVAKTPPQHAAVGGR
jgi:hypothetical protein